MSKATKFKRYAVIAPCCMGLTLIAFLNQYSRPDESPIQKTENGITSDNIKTTEHQLVAPDAPRIRKNQRTLTADIEANNISEIGQPFSLPMSDGTELKGKVDSIARKDTSFSFGVKLDQDAGRLVYFENDFEKRAVVFFDDFPTALKLNFTNNEWHVQTVPVCEILCASRSASYPLQPGMGLPRKQANLRIEEEQDRIVKRGAPAPFQSNPGAKAVVYCDFDGEIVDEPFWSEDAIVAEPSGLSDAQIKLALDIVAEDFAPFDVNVTNVRSVYDATPSNRRIMCVSTPTDIIAPSFGGVAGLFTFEMDVVCWNFNLASGQVAGDTISHEVGHTLGLEHDGDPSNEYYPGHESESIRWGSIMGESIEGGIVQWSKGEYFQSSSSDDDLAIMTENGISYRDDDYGNDLENAKEITITSDNITDVSGIIERNDDLDVFLVNFEGFGKVLFDGITERIPVNNLDLKVQILDDSGNLITDFNSTETETAVFEVNLKPGVYQIIVGGASSGSPMASNPTGWTSYGSLGNYLLSLVPDQGLEIAQAVDYYGNFTSDGDASWRGQISQTLDGVDAAVSGPIKDSEFSSFSISARTTAIEFFYKVDSESNFDFLEFFIDGQRVQRWSGDVDWDKFDLTNLSDELHTFPWHYLKDDSVSVGEDRAWIDSITISGTGGGYDDAMATDGLSPNGLGDKDLDGFEDFLEYTLGIDANSPEAEHPVAFSPDTRIASFQVDSSNQDVIVRVEISKNLKDWVPLAVSYAGDDFDTIDNVVATSQDLSNQMKRISLDLSLLDGEYRFVRVRAKKY